MGTQSTACSETEGVGAELQPKRVRRQRPVYDHRRAGRARAPHGGADSQRRRFVCASRVGRRARVERHAES
eukprot:6590174-Prymnesium_polylepis.1